jgi:hypothetical protein
MCSIPSRFQRPAHVAEVNYVPQSEVTVAGVPKCATQPDTKFSAQVAASMFFRGMAYTHLVALSMIVIRYMCPSSEEGRGAN